MDRSEIIFYLNGKRQVVSGMDVFLPLSSYLRYSLSLTGTKVVCSEGDCGACTVLLGWLDAKKELTYRIVDSCIQFVYQLDLCHIISVEGVGSKENLHPAQRAMIDHFASQCGFCTPGFVMAMVDLTEKNHTYDSTEIKDKLTGNLCRCTGYDAIVKAARSLSGTKIESITEKYDRTKMTADFLQLSTDNVIVRATDTFNEKTFIKPASLKDALAFKASHPTLRVVAGCTDVGVQTNKGRANDEKIMFIAHLHEMGGIAKSSDALNVGAVANWTDVRNICREPLPALAGILDIFAAEQIRNAATIGGNIMNGSPIADSLPALYALEAELTLQNASQTRTIPISKFFMGYKKFDMKPDEILTAVRIPLPAAGSVLRLYKVSRRKDLDISTVTLAIYLRISASKIQDVVIAAGGVGPTILRLTKTEAHLSGQNFSETVLLEAGKLAAGEITPISDVRASRDYRLQLVQNLFHKFYFEEISKSEVA